MRSGLSNALSNVIKALKLIGKDFIEMYLHFHVNLENHSKSYFLVIFKILHENEGAFQ